MSDLPDFAAEGLLDGLEGEVRAARLELLEELHGAGVPLEELRVAVAEERLTLLPVEQVLGGAGRHTAAEVAQSAGVEVEWLARQRQALGLPPPDPRARIFTDADVRAARRARSFRDAGFTEEAVLALLRVMSQAGAQVAGALRDRAGPALVRPGDTERDLGRRYAQLAREHGPQLGETMEYVIGVHLLEVIRRAEISRGELERGEVAVGSREVTVAFADLVGFTRLGAELSAGDLGEVAGRLAGLAAEVAQPPVRLVKTIGDAAMLVSEEPAPLVETGLALVDAVEAEGDEFPLLKAGVAHGPALSRAGDWYGHTVNLASRVTSIARPGSVLTTAEVHDLLADDFRWSFAGERKLKGIRPAVGLFRARRLEPDGQAA
jgi:adenylate cyclase